MHLHAGKTIRMQLQFPKDIGLVKKMLLNIKKKALYDIYHTEIRI
jgi:hypothetical protein